MILLRLLLLLSFSCCFHKAMAQPYYFRSYGVKEGMSGNAVISILQDSRKFMWFGTRNGLNRFDGTSFRTFRNDPEDSLSIGSNSIGCLFETNTGSLWVGTHKGIHIYDPRREVFTAFKKLPQVQIRAIIQDAVGHIWIIAGYELYRYNPVNDEMLHFTFGNEISTSLRLSFNKEVWVGTNTGVLKKYDHATNKFVRYEFSKSFPNPLQIGSVRDFLALSDSTILVGLPNQVLLFNINSLAVSDVFEKSRYATDLKVRSILAQSDSVCWIGTETGIYIINVKTGKIDRIGVERDNPYSLTDNVVFTGYKDIEGGTWIGTFYGGVNYYTAKYNKFHKYFHQSGPGGGFKGSVVHEITADDRGNLWVGTEDAGLNCMDTLTGKVIHFQAGGRKGDISDNKIHGLAAVDNELWIGTLDQGLDVMDLRTRKVIRHYNAGLDSNSLKSNFIVSLYRTKSNNILVGTSRGLFQYNRDKDNF
jgi:ligand-binding sensor domain-containing protein